MLVKDVRKEIEKYNKLELTEIIVELYKRIPKSKKEEYNIDDFIRDAQTKKRSFFHRFTKGNYLFFRMC